MTRLAHAGQVFRVVIKCVTVHVIYFISRRYPASIPAVPTKRLDFKLIPSDLAPGGAVGFIFPVFLPGINRAISLPGQLSATRQTEFRRHIGH